MMTWIPDAKKDRGQLSQIKDLHTGAQNQVWTVVSECTPFFGVERLERAAIYSFNATMSNVYVYMSQRICRTRYSPESLGNITRYSLT